MDGYYGGLPRGRNLLHKGEEKLLGDKLKGGDPSWNGQKNNLYWKERQGGREGFYK